MRRYYTIISTIILSVFLSNSLQPLFADYSEGSSASIAGSMVICTADGLKFIDFNNPNKPKEQKSSSPQHDCPFCFLGSNDDVLYMGEVTIIKTDLAFHAKPIYLSNLYKDVTNYILDHLATRAPPSFV